MYMTSTVIHVGCRQTRHVQRLPTYNKGSRRSCDQGSHHTLHLSHVRRHTRCTMVAAVCNGIHHRYLCSTKAAIVHMPNTVAPPSPSFSSHHQCVIYVVFYPPQILTVSQQRAVTFSFRLFYFVFLKDCVQYRINFSVERVPQDFGAILT